MKSIKFTLESSKIHLKFNIKGKKMTKQEFEKLIGKLIDEDTYESLKLVYLAFGDITNKELASMYVNDNQLFIDGLSVACEGHCRRKND